MTSCRSNKSNSLLKVTNMTGSQPPAVFLVVLVKGYNTKPANRVGPLSVSVLPDESVSSSPSWYVSILTGQINILT